MYYSRQGHRATDRGFRFALGASVLLAALSAAPAAYAATAAPKMVDVVSWAAGHPTAIQCDANLGGHAAPGQAAWTAYGGSVIYALPQICDASTAPVGSTGFALAIGTLVHEAAHARGVRSESCAEMTSDIGVFDALRRFYDVPFFTAMSIRVGAQVLATSRTLPPEYQPEVCWHSGRYG